MGAQVIGGSYRDPDGFVFQTEAGIFRQINHSYKREYRHLIDSGLYQQVTSLGLLIPHVETNQQPLNESGLLVIQPEQIPFISYPYEWSFSQLKDAALLTLQIQQKALKHGMTLKDASAYNVQFLRGKTIYIDTLSFAFYQEGQPWAPYKQFCEHFLVPLALMTYTDIRLNRLLLSFLEGVPIEIGSKMLPWATYFKSGLLLHLHLHAKAQRKYSSKETQSGKGKTMSKNALLQLLQSLESTIQSLTWKPDQTLWADYYAHTNYQDSAMQQKEQEVSRFLSQLQPTTLWDLGANTGRFSKLALGLGTQVIALDFDLGATDIHYLENKEKNLPILPLVMDFMQPSPAIGWRNQERASLLERPKPDTILALALVHHLAISKNLPLPHLASLLVNLCQNLIIEFVSKEDSQVQRLLRHREDIFPDYTQTKFEDAFVQHFTIIEQTPLQGGTRILYLFRKI